MDKQENKQIQIWKRYQMQIIMWTKMYEVEDNVYK